MATFFVKKSICTSAWSGGADQNAWKIGETKAVNSARSNAAVAIPIMHSVDPAGLAFVLTLCTTIQIHAAATMVAANTVAQN